MKNGKYSSLGQYQNIKIGYGTVDSKNFKTIYIKFKTWIEPLETSNFELLISKTSKKIKSHIFQYPNDFFHKESIVDINVKTYSIKLNKKSFMDLEITLFTKTDIIFNDKKLIKFIKTIIKDIIDNDFDNKNFYNFHQNKN